MNDNDTLKLLATKFRETNVHSELVKISKKYSEEVDRLISIGNWQAPPLEYRLPDEFMPESFFIYFDIMYPRANPSSGKKFISWIRSNQPCTANIADCVQPDYSFSPFEIATTKSMCIPIYAAGLVRLVPYNMDSNWLTHKGITDFPSDHIALIVPYNSSEKRAIVGGIFCNYLFEVRKAAGLVVCGLIRDLEELYKYPVWAKDTCPFVCGKRETPVPEKFISDQHVFNDGALICDRDGCVFVHKSQTNEEMIGKIQAKIEKEKDWTRKVNSKLSSFNIICEPKE